MLIYFKKLWISVGLEVNASTVEDHPSIQKPLI